jgi:hypothetical protein
MTSTVIKINDETAQTFTQSYDACLDAAQHEKANLIELLTYFEVEGWVIEMVASDNWNEQMNTTFWSTYWTGDVDALSNVIDCYNEFYPLN